MGGHFDHFLAGRSHSAILTSNTTTMADDNIAPAAPVAPAVTVPAADTPAATAAPPAPASVAKAPKAPAHFEDKDGHFKRVCRSFMNKKCTRGASCMHVHDTQLCRFFFRSGTCKNGAECRKNHFLTISEKKSGGADEADASGVTDAETSDAAQDAKKSKKPREKKVSDKKSIIEESAKEDASGKPKDASNNNNNRSKQSEANGDGSRSKADTKKSDAKKKHQKTRSAKKNTECFDPMTKPVDLRITYDLGTKSDTFSTSLTTRDVLLVPNLFSDFKDGELYAKLVAEIESCGIPTERLLKLWHGNNKIDGTHLIADDKTRWKNNSPTFDLVIDRVKTFFNMSVKATRFNWYKDTSQWKPFHFDAAAVKAEIAAIQNFTVGISFGATRDAAFEHADSKTVVSIPQPDGCLYAFSKDTNIIWRHGILQDRPVRDEGRISVIAWGWIDGMVDQEEQNDVAAVVAAAAASP